MKKFEYKKIYYKPNLIELLNEEGKKGWELVCNYNEAGYTVFLLKRKIVND